MVCMNPGMVFGSTKILLTNVMGNSSIMLLVITEMIHSQLTAELRQCLRISAGSQARPALNFTD